MNRVYVPKSKHMSGILMSYTKFFSFYYISGSALDLKSLPSQPSDCAYCPWSILFSIKKRIRERWGAVLHGLGHREYARQVADAFQKFQDYQEDDFRIPPVSHFQSSLELVFTIQYYNRRYWLLNKFFWSGKIKSDDA